MISDKKELEYLLNFLRKNRITYAEYLQTEHWAKTREKRLSQSLCYCAVCGRDNYLHVHHETYKNIGQEKMTDLKVLCWIHHKKLHEFIEINKTTFASGLKSLIENARNERLSQTKYKKRRKLVSKALAKTKSKRERRKLMEQLAVEHSNFSINNVVGWMKGCGYKLGLTLGGGERFINDEPFTNDIVLQIKNELILHGFLVSAERIYKEVNEYFDRRQRVNRGR
jgi:hypothetical protein